MEKINKAKAKVSAQDFMPMRKTINSLRAAAKNCRGCHLYKNATQTVFGSGKLSAKLIVVGEIPGNQEDKIGEPFVGPAGSLLHNFFNEAEIDWEDIYLTNVVKHFKFKLIQNKRLHRSPLASEISACMPWLSAEIHVLNPRAILCLGSIAAKSLIHKEFKVTEQRGKWYKINSHIKALATFHPSAILRAREDKKRHEMKKIFLKDIKKAAAFLGQLLAVIY